MKRWIWRAPLFLLLGAAINVAVAWGCGLWGQVPQVSFSVGSPPPHMSALMSESWQTGPGRTISQESASAGLTIENVIVEVTGAAGQGAMYRVYRQQSGWPWRALECHALFEYGSGRHGPRQWRWGVESDRWLRPHPDHDDFAYRRPIALLPVLPGFLANSAVYGVSCAAGAMMLCALRRKARRSRSLCIGCAYPTDASPVCTECGMPAKPSPAVTA